VMKMKMVAAWLQSWQVFALHRGEWMKRQREWNRRLIEPWSGQENDWKQKHPLDRSSAHHRLVDAGRSIVGSTTCASDRTNQ